MNQSVNQNNWESVLQRFDDDDEDVDAEENTVDNFGITKDQEYEFKVAFNLLSDGKDTLSYDKLYDLFLSVGFTFPDHELRKLCQHCQVDRHGNYSLDGLIEAFDNWKKNQIRVNDLQCLYAMIANDHIIYEDFPYQVVDISKIKGIEVKAWIPILKDLLHDTNISMDEAHKFAEELSTSENGNISFEDFLRIFSAC